MDLKSCDAALPEIIELIRKGIERKSIEQSYDKELVSIAYARVRDEKVNKPYLMNESDLRFATNPIVAQWRAQRLKCDTLVEIGCGVGIQTIAFARACKRVIAIDTDARKVDYAKENLKLEGITNVEFIVGDGLEYLKKAKSADIVFIDPERLASEPLRSIDTIRPSIPDILKAAKRLTDKVAIELPPQLRDIDFDCEKEYCSLNHELNRLTIYFGSLKRSAASAAILPSQESFTGESQPVQKRGDYLYEIDPAIEKAGLKQSLGLQQSDIPSLLCANKRLSSPCYKHVFRTLYVGNPLPENVKRGLKGIGRLILRAKIDPKDYWNRRKQYEEGLSGPGVAHLFIESEIAYVLEVLD